MNSFRGSDDLFTSSALFFAVAVFFPLLSKYGKKTEEAVVGKVYIHPKSEYIKSKPARIRFNDDANNRLEAIEYFQNRTRQGLLDGLVLLESPEQFSWGYAVTFTHIPVKKPTSYNISNIYHSVYIYNSERSKGHFSNWLKENPLKVILSTSDCQLERYLSRKGRKRLSIDSASTQTAVPGYIIENPSSKDWVEYRLVSQFYGDHMAERSRVHLMNHIDEGLYVMKYINATEDAMRAYCLHPLIQGDEDFREYQKRLNDAEWTGDEVRLVDARVLLLAVEYRSVANEYLSLKTISDNVIRLSPLKEVNDMLIADKIQNRKDFELYHKQTHERKERLSEYFNEWLEALGVEEQLYQLIKLNIVKRINGYRHDLINLSNTSKHS